MNPDPNLRSGSGPNPVQKVREPDRGQSKYNGILLVCRLGDGGVDPNVMLTHHYRTIILIIVTTAKLLGASAR